MLYINVKTGIIILMKRLYRSTSDVKIFGICSGIAEYLTIDPTVIRVIYLTVTVFSGLVPGVVVYLLLAWIIPQRSK